MREQLKPVIKQRAGGKSPDGLLLVGHGTRDAEGVAEFLAAARRVAQQAGGLAVEPSFLEFAEPTIAQGVARLVERGASHLTVVPVLLFSAGHAQVDIPAAVARPAAAYPEVTIEQSPHLGCDERIVALSKRRYDEALAGRAAISPDETALVLVGRGSHDAAATAEMRRFVELRRAHGDARHVRTAFIAMAEPSLTAVLDEVPRLTVSGQPGSDLPVRRVVVQPHLLFGGVLVDRIAGVAAPFAARQPAVEWLIAEHLGDCELLAEAILAPSRVSGGW